MGKCSAGLRAEILLPPCSRATATVTIPDVPDPAGAGRPGQAGWPRTVSPIAQSGLTQQPASADADGLWPASAATALTKGAIAAGTSPAPGRSAWGTGPARAAHAPVPSCRRLP